MNKLVRLSPKNAAFALGSRAVVSGAFLLLLAVHVSALDVPRLQGRVNDYADMISPATERTLNEKLAALEQSDSTQVVILTIPSLKGEPLEEFSIKVAEAWKIGQKGLDNGVLLLVSRNDRKVRIEVGYGLEGPLTDLLAGRIVDYEIVPAFKAGKFDQGFLQGVEAITEAVRGEYKAEPAKAGGEENDAARYFPFFILALVVAMMGTRHKILGATTGAIFFPILAMLLLPGGWLLLLLAPLGFFGGWFLPALLFSSAMRPHRGGGFFGGGFSSGGGGGGFSGGGFSGGGGSFGGGGASGGW